MNMPMTSETAIRGRTNRTRRAEVAAASLTLGHPAADWIATAVIAMNDVVGIHWTSARKIADNAAVRTGRTPGRRFRRNRETKGDHRGDKSKDRFHECGERDVFTSLRRGSAEAIQPIPKKSSPPSEALSTPESAKHCRRNEPQDSARPDAPSRGGFRGWRCRRAEAARHVHRRSILPAPEVRFRTHRGPRPG